MPSTHPALPEVRSVSGDALVALLGVADTVARWGDALPNDPDVFRDAARAARDAIEFARLHAPAARKAVRPLSTEERSEAMRHRNAYFRAKACATDAAWRSFGFDWGKLPGNRVFAHCSRELRIYVSKTGRVSYEAATQIVPARQFWDAVPDGLVFADAVPCAWNPDLSRLKAEGRAWSKLQDTNAAQLAA